MHEGKGVPEKCVRIVKNTYVEARTKVKSSVGLTSTITIRHGCTGSRHQGAVTMVHAVRGRHHAV